MFKERASTATDNISQTEHWISPTDIANRILTVRHDLSKRLATGYPEFVKRSNVDLLRSHLEANSYTSGNRSTHVVASLMYTMISSSIKVSGSVADNACSTPQAGLTDDTMCSVLENHHLVRKQTGSCKLSGRGRTDNAEGTKTQMKRACRTAREKNHMACHAAEQKISMQPL